MRSSDLSSLVVQVEHTTSPQINLRLADKR
jgi:hypothetical protein